MNRNIILASLGLFFSIVFFAIYYQTLDNPLIFDSQNAYKLYIGWGYEFLGGRRLSHVSFRLINDLSPYIEWQRLANILLHFLNSVLLFWFLNRLTSNTNKVISLFISIFFLVNPASIYAVCYLVQRSVLMCTGLVLLGGIVLTYAARTKHDLLALLYIGLTGLCCVLAFSSKEHALPVMGFYFVLMYFLTGFGRRFYLCVLLALPIISYSIPKVFDYRFVLGTNREVYHTVIAEPCGYSGDLFIRSILTQCSLFFEYILHWMLPLQTSIDMRFALLNDTPINYLVVFALVGLFICSLISLRQKSIIGLGLCYAMIMFSTELISVRSGEMFVMYRSYLWSIGFMMLLAFLYEVKNKKAIYSILLLLLIGLSIVTYKRLDMFNSESKAWVQAVNLISTNKNIRCQGIRANTNAGRELLKEGKTKAGLFYTQEALALNPPSLVSPFIRINEGYAYKFLGRFEDAYNSYKLALQEAIENKNEKAEQSAKIGLARIGREIE